MPSKPKKDNKDPFKLSKSIISIPLLEKMEDSKESDILDVIIDINLNYKEGRAAARTKLIERIKSLQRNEAVETKVFDDHPQYIFVSLSKARIKCCYFQSPKKFPGVLSIQARKNSLYK